MKSHFDVAIIVPLDEEFETALKHFTFIADRSTPQRIRFEVSVSDSEAKILLVKQNVMGRADCTNATMDVVDEFDVGLLVCLGIAGGLSNDVSIGDVCRTGGILDLLDNAKVQDVPSSKPKKKSGAQSTKTKSNGHTVSFSTTHYETPMELSVALDLDRLVPVRRESYERWESECALFGEANIPNEFTGKEGKKEKISAPVVRRGLIACTAVSGSVDYNEEVKKADRKILAIETESGGLFLIARRYSIPALAVRGISDYAGFGVDKNVFERETNNKARLIAANNAASYLAHQLANPRLVDFLIGRRQTELTTSPASTRSTVDVLSDTIINQAEYFNSRLKELAPGFGLQRQGYRIPVPRVRLQNGKLEGVLPGEERPYELRDALPQTRVLVIQVPPEFPDRSLAWIVGKDLLTTLHNERQILPTVIEARDLRRPNDGLSALAEPTVIALKDASEAQIVFVVDEFNFESRSQTQFLLDEVTGFANAKFVILSRNRSNIVSENEFVRKTGAIVGKLDDVSFLETSHFLQKNFELSGPEAEVIAVRLYDTFRNFKLSAHPTYFAGIPANTLSALLRANKRAELIDLAVAGYLSYVVAQDNEPLTLSRTTREKFLTLLAFEMKVNKTSFTEAQLTNFASQFAIKFDYKISPVRFCAAFIDNRILYVEGGKIRFTLPFMECFLLAKKLHEEPQHACTYFHFGDNSFDVSTFKLYAELGVADELVKNLSNRLDISIADIRTSTRLPPTIISNDIQPALLSKNERVNGMKKRLERAISDVSNDRDASHEKQRLLDAAERIRVTASQRSQEIVDENKEEKRTVEGDALEIWYVTLSLLGSGAERLEASVKRALVAKIITLSALILGDWTAQSARVDYKKMKQDLVQDRSLLKDMSGGEEEFDEEKAKRGVESLVDLLEYSLVTHPFRAIVQCLCEEARDGVLAESVVHTDVEGSLEQLLKGIWLADLDTPTGVRLLKQAIKAVPNAKLLRMSLASHLIARVYWRHWDRENRLKLLDAAQESLKAAGLAYDKEGLKRLIEKEQ